ncbi:acid-sensing ion channel 2-like [Lineus longissimus]|uniref:acid-sensing ion channel 2-like n=1 Tax=Lineus longissimus TaxID=88925 RepID=UPI002B4D2A6D
MVLRGGALKKAVETNGLGQDLLKTSIFFETLQFQTNLEERSYLFVNLLSDIGGQSGLWVGLSVLSGMEILEFFYVIAKCLLRLKVQSDEDRGEEKIDSDDDEAANNMTCA